MTRRGVARPSAATDLLRDHWRTSCPCPWRAASGSIGSACPRVRSRVRPQPSRPLPRTSDRQRGRAQAGSGPLPTCADRAGSTGRHTSRSRLPRCPQTFDRAEGFVSLIKGSRRRSWCSANRFGSHTTGRSWHRNRHIRRVGRHQDSRGDPTSSPPPCSSTSPVSPDGWLTR